jgi:hypothetical protein
MVRSSPPFEHLGNAQLGFCVIAREDDATHLFVLPHREPTRGGHTSESVSQSQGSLVRLYVSRGDSQSDEGCSTGLLINHFQRLPPLSPGAPWHIPGTPNLSSTHSWHTGVYAFIATTFLFSRTSSTSAASFTPSPLPPRESRLAFSWHLPRRSSASRSRSLRNTRSYASSRYLSRS